MTMGVRLWNPPIEEIRDCPYDMSDYLFAEYIRPVNIVDGCRFTCTSGLCENCPDALTEPTYPGSEYCEVINRFNYYYRQFFPARTLGYDKWIYNDELEWRETNYDLVEEYDYDGIYVGPGSFVMPEETLWKVQANIACPGEDLCMAYGKIFGLSTTEVYSASPLYPGRLRLAPGLASPLDLYTKYGVLVTEEGIGWVVGEGTIRAYGGFTHDDGKITPVGEPLYTYSGMSWRFLDTITAYGAWNVLTIYPPP
jgi:hypothetical protein